jgi:hypothetical protein
VIGAFHELTHSESDLRTVRVAANVALSDREGASSGIMQTEKELQEAEARRQAFIRAQQTSAKDWWDSSRTYFIVKLNLGGTLASWTKGQTTHEGDDASGALQAIEAVGWRLDHIGYVYQPLKERAAPIVESVMAGNVVGIYTFRRPEVPPTPLA